MSELTLMMSTVAECVDCCSQSAAASAEVFLAEVFVVVVKFLLMSFVGVVCRLLLCSSCQRAACSVIESGMLENSIAFCDDCV